ncbi:hypothetical protein [Cytobacillus massiliigabonensis]|uniref:hypothetical protein n=1 Tax=Cytobacillus massiliigabonensis TaxID=1871011 RepID=UPI0011580D41|nr:hypothetical protein [Cytobacillus massiliigabonensis]
MRITENNGMYYLEGEEGAANSAMEIIVYNHESLRNSSTEVNYIEVNSNGSFESVELTGISVDNDFWVVASYDLGNGENRLSNGTKMTTPSSSNSGGGIDGF